MHKTRVLHTNIEIKLWFSAMSRLTQIHHLPERNSLTMLTYEIFVFYIINLFFYFYYNDHIPNYNQWTKVFYQSMHPPISKSTMHGSLITCLLSILDDFLALHYD